MVRIMVVLQRTTTITVFRLLERPLAEEKHESKRILRAQKEEKTAGWLFDRSGQPTSQPLEVADFQAAVNTGETNWLSEEVLVT